MFKGTSAILMALGIREGMDPLQQYRPTPLMRIADKAIIVQIIECLARMGIGSFEIILHHLPDTIESTLGDGSRWGVRIRYHLAKNPQQPFIAAVPILYSSPAQQILLGTGDCLPVFPESFYTTPPPLLLDADNSRTGWGLFSSEELLHLIKANPNFSLNESSLPSLSTNLLFSSQSSSELLASNIRFLHSEEAPAYVPSTASQPEKGIWISRGAVIHPSVKMIAPLFIGEEAQVHKDVTLGPDAVIENRSLIDEGSTVTRSLVCHDSYVGEGLNVENSIIERNLIVNIEHGSILEIKDNFILSRLSYSSPLRNLFHLLGRVVAWLLILLFSPVLALLFILFPLIQRAYVLLPSPEALPPHATFEWPYFDIKGEGVIKNILRELPALFPLSKGDLHWVGTSPLTPIEADSLPSYWKKLYFHSKAGLITLAGLDYGPEATGDERYASDAYYSAHSSVYMDCKLLFRKILSPLKNLLERKN